MMMAMKRAYRLLGALAIAAFALASAPAAGYFVPVTRAFMKAAGLPGLWW